MPAGVDGRQVPTSAISEEAGTCHAMAPALSLPILFPHLPTLEQPCAMPSLTAAFACIWLLIHITTMPTVLTQPYTVEHLQDAQLHRPVCPMWLLMHRHALAHARTAQLHCRL